MADRIKTWTQFASPSGLALNYGYDYDPWVPDVGVTATNYTLLRTLAQVHVYMPEEYATDPWAPIVSRLAPSLVVYTYDEADGDPTEHWYDIQAYEKVMVSPLVVTGAYTAPPDTAISFGGYSVLHWDLQPGTWDSRAMRRCPNYPKTKLWVGPPESGFGTGSGFTVSLSVRQLYEFEVV